MKKCNKCKVNILSSESKCPLCFTNVKKTDKSIVDYPNYNYIKGSRKKISRIPLFITIISIIILIYINVFSHRSGNIFWSGIGSISILYVYSMFLIIKAKWSSGTKLFYSYVSLSIMLIVIDLFSGMFYWSTNYVVPFLTTGIALLLTVLALADKNFFVEYFGYILASALCSIFPVVMYLIGFNNNLWGVFIALLAILITTIALYLFADETLKMELKKRFHIN